MAAILPKLRLAHRFIIHKSKPFQISPEFPGFRVFSLDFSFSSFDNFLPKIVNALVNLFLSDDIVEDNQTKLMIEFSNS
jgi:hypothetical protein